jgi:signal transduction histidine kinase
MKQAAGPVNEKQAEYLNIIKKSSERLLNLINELLDISKIEAGTFGVEKRRVDIVSVIDEAIRQISPLAAAKQIVVENKSEKGRYIIDADDYRMIQVIVNLLGNSMKFSFNNTKIRISVCDKRLDDVDRPYYTEKLPDAVKKVIVITLKDEGVGLTPEAAVRVFEKFFQIETAGVRKHQGAGLGLTISKNIVEAHDGLIWAESEGENKGTTFNIVLPYNT